MMDQTSDPTLAWLEMISGIEQDAIKDEFKYYLLVQLYQWFEAGTTIGKLGGREYAAYTCKYSLFALRAGLAIIAIDPEFKFPKPIADLLKDCFYEYREKIPEAQLITLQVKERNKQRELIAKLKEV